MLDEKEKRILSHPEFQLLVRRRKILGLTLTGLMIVGYLTLAILSSNAPEAMSAPVVSGGTIPIGILIGYCLILSAVICAMMYTKISNAWFEKHLETIRMELSNDDDKK